MSDELTLPKLNAFGDFGPAPSAKDTKAAVSSSDRLMLSCWYDAERDQEGDDVDARTASWNKMIERVFSDDVHTLKDRLPSYVLHEKTLQKSRQRTALERANVKWSQKQGHNQFHSETVTFTQLQVKAELPVEGLWKNLVKGCLPKTRQTVRQCGRPPKYNENLEKTTFSSTIPLETHTSKRINAETVREELTTQPLGPLTEDPIIAAITEELVQDDASHKIVVTSDDVMASLMGAAVSVNSWDVEVMMAERIVLLSRREGTAVDTEWVNENASGDNLPSDDTDETNINTRANLGKESTKVNSLFSQQAGTKAFVEIKTEKTDPTVHTRQILYTYELFTINADLPSRFDLLVRCQVDAAQPKTAAKGESEYNFFRCFGLLEYQPTVDLSRRAWNAPPLIQWSNNQLSTILARESRNNMFKFARWAAMSHLSGTQMKIGFVTRKVEGNKKITHAVGGVHTCDPMAFANSIDIHVEKLWSSFATIMETLLASNITDGGIARIGGNKNLFFFQKDEEDDDDDDEDDEDEDEDDAEDDE